MLLFAGFSQVALAQKQKGGTTKPPGESPFQTDELFIDATKAELLENFKEALMLYKKVAEADPTNATVQYKIAELHARQNQFSDALPYAKKAVDLYKENQFFWLQLAQLEEATGNWKNSIQAYEDIMKRFKETQAYLLTVAQIYIKNSEYKKAIKALDKAEKEMGPSREIFQVLQSLHLKQNQLDKALEEGRKAIQAFPDDPEPRFSYAQLLMSNNKSEEAEKELLKIVDLFPSFPAVHLMLADLYVTRRDLAKADKEIELAFLSPELAIGAKIDLVASYLHGMDSAEDQKKADHLTDLILQAHPEEPKALLIKGDILNRQNKKREARDYYVKAVSHGKNNFALWEQIVLIDLNLNELDSVVKHTSEAKTLFPNTPSFAFYNGLGNLMTKKYPEAAEALEHAKRISLDNRTMQLEIYAQLGDVYHNLSEKEKSFEAYDEVLRLDSSNAHVLNNYAYYLSLDKTRLDKALKMSSRLVALFPEDATYLDTHGWVLYEKKDYAEARKFLEKAAQKSNSGVIWEHYGDTLFKLGLVQEASDAWKKAKELGGELSSNIDKKLKDKKLYE